MTRAEIKNPDTFEAPSNVEKRAPMARKREVIHFGNGLANLFHSGIDFNLTIVVANTKIQYVKKAPADIVRPTMK
jgi:hypothetical protein